MWVYGVRSCVGLVDGDVIVGGRGQWGGYRGIGVAFVCYAVDSMSGNQGRLGRGWEGHRRVLQHVRLGCWLIARFSGLERDCVDIG